ncbi:MAG: S8/S53 family peptidase [Myxococcota bacterium]
MNLLLAIILAGCHRFDRTPMEGCGSRAVVSTVPASALCPTAPGWTTRRLFTDSNPALAQWLEPRPERLHRYCHHTRSGTGPLTVGEMAPLQAALDARDLASGQDCSAQVRPNGLDDPRVDEALIAAFHHAIDLPDPSVMDGIARAPVEIAILDTASEETAAASTIVLNRSHGLMMREIVEEIACLDDTPPCLGAIRSAVAMPRHDGMMDWAEGGRSGTALDLATAIVAAVGRWRSRSRAAPGSVPQRLILSLSLGWPEDPNRPASPATAVLEDALAFAACNGALVITASGNTARDGSGTGPLTPARYQSAPAPNAETCVALGFAPLRSHLPIDGGVRPLVVAVGGVDAHDRTLYNARPGSQPPLVAFAEQTIARPSDGDARRIPLTGTSVSAAVASGAAGLLWSIEPSLTPDAVIERLYTSGWDVGRVAEVDLPGPPRRSHRIAICPALATLRPDAARCEASPVPDGGFLAPVGRAIQQALADDPNVHRIDATREE